MRRWQPWDARVGSARLCSCCTVLTAGGTAPPAAGHRTGDRSVDGAAGRVGKLRSASSATPPRTSPPRSAPPCGVPIDDANPAGPQAQLAVIKIPASGERIGALFVNPGGPGASAVDAVAGMGYALAGSPINEHFDLVGFDPRGVGYSTPGGCGAAPTPNSTRGGATRWSTTAPPAWPPSSRSTATTPPNAPTRWAPRSWPASEPHSAAKDMDTVRQVLGDDKINYLGFSYGTELGTAYVEQLPGPGARDGARRRHRPRRGHRRLDHPADGRASRWRSTTTPPTARSRPAARWAPIPAQWVNRFHQLVDPLVAKPGPTSDPRGLSYQDAITGTFNALYTPQYWKFLTSGLLGLQRADRRRRPAAARRRVRGP